MQTAAARTLVCLLSHCLQFSKIFRFLTSNCCFDDVYTIVCDSANYRSTILTILPHLEVLDAERLKSVFSITDVTSQLHKRFPSKPHELIRQFLDTNTTPIIDWSQGTLS